ncbi:MAG: NAD-dependent malic enzyme, partial [Candidatus Altiarchaeales archaeon HGW-Altiarchaeales-1]
MDVETKANNGNKPCKEEIFETNLMRKIELKRKNLKSKRDLAMLYTPGIADVCLEIKKNETLVDKYTSKRNLIAIVTDGSRILGLGNIGKYAGIPVMESKSLIYKQFGDVDAIPISLATQNKAEIINVIKAISPSFGGINLEDIESPKALEIYEELIKTSDIPVFHDDQQGTAIITLAGLINALKILKKDRNVKICIAGCGSAGIGITKLLLAYGFKNIIVTDSKGAIHNGRTDLNKFKEEIAMQTNKGNLRGNLKECLSGADVFIGVSGVGNLIKKEDIKQMNKQAIVFALTNPIPEIFPDEIKNLDNVGIIATGRSDFPNQINNAVVFPGFMKFLLKNRIRKITPDMEISAAETIA